MSNYFGMFNKKQKDHTSDRSQKINLMYGFSLVETIVAFAIFLFVAVGIYAGFVNILRIMNIIRTKEVMTNIASEQFEIARNLPYQDVGTIGGIPSGVLSQSTDTVIDNKNFNIGFVVRNVDDPFDGTFGGDPDDSSPADMKLVEVTITCTSCDSSLSPISFTTKVAPKNLETASTNGALVVKVFDSSGLPVPLADVNIFNDSVIPNVDLNDQTDVNGLLTIVDAPPSVNGYRITVSKTGYSSDHTYAVDDPSNPNPTKTDVTVVIQQISQISFVIDKVSTINFSSTDSQCAVTPNFNFDMVGDKLVGTSPDVYKYSESLETDASGLLTLSDVEWDTYLISGTDTSYDIIGTNPLLSLGINPDVTQDMKIITAPKNGRRLLVVVRDQSTGLPIAGATVDLTNGGSYSNTLITDEDFLTQTDWSGGAGQTDFSDQTKFFEQDGNIDISTVGELSLVQTLGNYVASGNLTSSTFDTGGASDFKELTWNPTSQSAGTDVLVQIATNNDNATWSFLGPDGTNGTYYSSSSSTINSIHNGDRYLRYRLYFSTSDQSVTPSISDISITYSSVCTPPGQVSFSGLSADTYTITITKSGYQGTSKNVDVSDDWTKEEITISP